MSKTIDINLYDQTAVYNLDFPMPTWRWVSKIFGPVNDIPGVNFDDLIIEHITLPNGAVLGPVGSFGSGHTTYYPDFPEVSTISVGFYETDSGAANLALGNWRNAVRSNQGWYGLPVDYKCDMLTNLFGYSSNTQAVLTYSAQGLWPTDAGSIELSYTTDERLILNVTLSCDAIILGNRAGGI